MEEFCKIIYINLSNLGQGDEKFKLLLLLLYIIIIIVFIVFIYRVNATEEERRVALEEDSAAWFFGCASLTFFQFVISLLSVFLLHLTAALQVIRIQSLFFKSIVCQDMAWYDTSMEGNFVGKATK
mgnify:CR=1 FL=1